MFRHEQKAAVVGPRGVETVFGASFQFVSKRRENPRTMDAFATAGRRGGLHSAAGGGPYPSKSQFCGSVLVGAKAPTPNADRPGEMLRLKGCFRRGPLNRDLAASEWFQCRGFVCAQRDLFRGATPRSLATRHRTRCFRLAIRGECLARRGNSGSLYVLISATGRFMTSANLAPASNSKIRASLRKRNGLCHIPWWVMTPTIVCGCQHFFCPSCAPLRY